MSPFKLEFWLSGVPSPMNQVLKWHWAKRQKYYDQWHAAIARTIGLAAKPKSPLTSVQLTFERHAYRTLDFDGCVASMKPLADGLVHLGVLKNDTWAITGKWDVDQTFRPKGQECVFVRVEERASGL